jgi:competence protein ComEC
MLLTGDAEARSERELIERVPGELRADLLVVPHHGSSTSSTDDFIAAVMPRWAVFTVGYRNRLGHPKEEIVERYRVSGAQMLRTDGAGAVLVRLDGEGISVQSYREMRKRYWYAD